MFEIPLAIKGFFSFIPEEWRTALLQMLIAVGIVVGAILMWNMWLSSHDAEVRRIAIEETDTKWEDQIDALEHENEQLVAESQIKIDKIEADFFEAQEKLRKGRNQYVENVTQEFGGDSNPVVFSGGVSDYIRSFNPSKLRSGKDTTKP